MHDIKWIRENPKDFDKGLARRGLPPESQRLASIDDRRRAIIRVLEQNQARRNAVSKEIGVAKKNKDEVAAARLMEDVASLKESISTMEKEEKDASKELDDELARIPNLPLDDVPDGRDEKGNLEHHKYFSRERRIVDTQNFPPKQHFELGEALGLMDFETAGKLSGARFVVLKKGLARLERALAQFMLDLHTGDTHGYTEIAPPLLVRDEVMFGTAQLPKFADDQFFNTRLSELETLNVTKLSDRQAKLAAIRNQKLEIVRQLESGAPSKNPNDLKRELIAKEFQERRLQEEIWEIRPTEGLWLIPTAEVPLTNLVRESILEEAELPMRLTACTPCFRAEAGAAGKDTRGMIRQHQFTKVELVSITTPEQSRDEHERMLSCAEEVLRRLDLHYRVVTLCTGDMGFASQKTYDIEVWLPGQHAFREISSCSVCGDFQARRMNARYRDKDRKVRHVHTLNGSGVAVGRALIAVMENYQQADGSIAVPEVLQPYMGNAKSIRGPKSEPEAGPF